jgi:ADP-heptose:LPS heptosyltransferase
VSEKILVIHQGALGDVILSFPALESLKRERSAFVALLCKDQVGRMARELGVVDGHFPVESARFSGLFSSQLGEDMHDFIGEYGIIVLVGFSEEMEEAIGRHAGGAMYRITPRPRVEEENHVSVHLKGQLQECGLLRHQVFEMAKQRPCFPCLAEHPGIKTSLGNRLLIHPGAGSKRKRWPLENFIRVAAATTRMGATEVAFVIGPAETDLLSLLTKRSEGRFSVYAVQDLKQVMRLMNRSWCFLGNDSGLTHLAAVKGLPTVAIFGPSNPNRWWPIGCATAVLRGDADCAPCFEVAEANCDHPQCLNGVSVEVVLETIRGFSNVQKC